jgi:protocatechuate 3,4-dioxygenase, alpha subunit
MRDERPRAATPSQTVGPFFHVALTPEPSGGMAAAFPEGDPIRLSVSVTDGDGKPVDDAVLELWHVGTTAHASVQGSDSPPVARFGRMPTSADGTCEFDTVRPGRTPDGRGRLQAAHINVCLFARGLLRQLHTRIYFAGDPGLDEDAGLASVPADRRATLLAHPDPQDAGRWIFHVRLQGSQETVFFDP